MLRLCVTINSQYNGVTQVDWLISRNATFGYRKAHGTNDEILHHTGAYPKVKFYQVQCYN